MRRRGFFLLTVFSLLICFSLSASAQDAMSNDEVISLTKAGLANSVIIGKIRTSKPMFDLSTDSLIKLKQAGVHDDVVTAMLEAKTGRPISGPATSSTTADPDNPMSKHTFGIYLYEEKEGKGKMTQMKPTVSAQNRTGGLFTSSLTYGISKVKTKANLPGRTADMQIPSTAPVFYFYLDAASGGLNTASGVPSDPKEFTLVRFNQRDDNREVTIAKSNAFGGKGGLSDEYVVQFKAEDLGDGIFKVSPMNELKKGEYGFYLVNSGNSNAAAAVGTKFFDFGVNPIP